MTEWFEKGLADAVIGFLVFLGIGFLFQQAVTIDAFFFAFAYTLGVFWGFHDGFKWKQKSEEKAA